MIAKAVLAGGSVVVSPREAHAKFTGPKGGLIESYTIGPDGKRVPVYAKARKRRTGVALPQTLMRPPAKPAPVTPVYRAPGDRTLQPDQQAAVDAVRKVVAGRSRAATTELDEAVVAFPGLDRFVDALRSRLKDWFDKPFVKYIPATDFIGVDALDPIPEDPENHVLVIEAIERDGRLRSLHETGAGRGLPDVEIRKAWEARHFGAAAAKFKAGTHPEYGQIDADGDNPDVTTKDRQYGEVTFVLADRLKARSTVTYDDSSIHDVTPATLYDDGIDPVMMSPGVLGETIANWKEERGHGEYSLGEGDAQLRWYAKQSPATYGPTIDRILEMYRTGFSYAEVQIHGGVDLTDVEAVRVPHAYKSASADSQQGRAHAAIWRMINKYGWDLEYVD